jgi:hypothetical protein
MVLIWYGTVVCATVFLGACWYVSEISTRSKTILTLAYLASWSLLLIPGYDFLFYLAQIVIFAVAGVATFGLDWLIGRQ